MANGNYKSSNNNPPYDPRWFIWTIVFLVVTGISLVSYIVFSDTGMYEVAEIGVHKTAKTK
jgi:hypothetical protein